uniref:Pre-nudix hydrolase domain-containing protein n=1 Tax=Solanum lycopersicum TaxID=4081 RepID=A0A3Q7GGW0_SOLLC
MGENRQVFEADEDAYGGMNVHIKDSIDSIKFIAMLRASITQWTNQGKKGVWIKLHIEYYHLVNDAVKATYCMLVYWIPQTPHTIPSNASHRVDTGALV